jgi:uncharacterized protein (TIGR03437 family)
MLASLAQLAVANHLTLQQVALTRGSSTSLRLDFSQSAAPVAALQFDLEYDSSAIGLVPTLGAAARQSGKVLYVASISATKKRFLIAGSNLAQIPTGTLIGFAAQVNFNAALPGYTLKVSDVAAAAPNGEWAPLAAEGGTIAIQAGPSEPLSASGVMSAASLSLGPISPGEIVTLFGNNIGPASPALPSPGPAIQTLNGTSVWIGGRPAPLLYAGPNQINAVVPFLLSSETVPGGTAQVVIQKGQSTWATATVPVRAASPAIFTMNGSGAGPGAVLNQDSTLNSADNPARKGSIMSIYATGAGLLDPPAIDGAVTKEIGQRPLLPVTVKVGNTNAEILYAGPAPGAITGLLQVNARISAEAPAGAAVEIILTIGGVESPPGVTLAIR